MKINSVNMEVYRSASILNRQTGKQSAKKPTQSSHTIEGAEFSKYLDQKELKFLASLFKGDSKPIEEKNSQNGNLEKRHRIDIIA